jgi:hypothetical protein
MRKNTSFFLKNKKFLGAECVFCGGQVRTTEEHEKCDYYPFFGGKARKRASKN